MDINLNEALTATFGPSREVMPGVTAYGYQDALAGVMPPSVEVARHTIARVVAATNRRPFSDTVQKLTRNADRLPKPQGDPVAEAKEKWDAAAHDVANTAAMMLSLIGPLPVMLTREDAEELLDAIQVRNAAQEEWLRALAGHPTIPAVPANSPDLYD